MCSLRLRVVSFLMAVLGTSVVPRSGPATPLGTAFTYQGQLEQSESAVNGTCDFQFSLFDAGSGGAQQGTTQTLSAVNVTDGLFTVQLNGSSEFGANPFGGSERWLQIAVRCPVASGSYVTLSPRQQLTATPYALYAPAAGSANGLNCSGCVTGSAIASGTIPASSLAFTPGTVTSITAGTGLSGGTITSSGTIGNSGVLSVEASAPLASSGGQNPSVSLSGTVPVANGGTGAGSAAGARSNLVAAGSGSNSDITSLSGITGNIALPHSTSASVGVVTKGGAPFIHDFGTWSTFVGASAGNFSMTGAYSTAVGSSVLNHNTTGTANTAVGSYALADNTTGSDNTALGYGALNTNTTGDENTALGYGALNTNTTGVDNTAVGTNALEANTTGEYNTAVGAYALSSNDTGYENTALGYDALEANTTGRENTAVGDEALYSNTTGIDNTALGYAALWANTTGKDNTAVGYGALADNTTGILNTAVGESALSSNDTGIENTALGYAALDNNTTGHNNTAVGNEALEVNTTGVENTALGYLALYHNTTGVRNTALGNSAGTNIVGGHDNIAIGAGAGLGSGDESNTIRIGTAGTQTATYIAGISGATSSGGAAVYVNSSGRLGIATSSARFKEDIRDMGGSTSALMKLRPVRFRYKKDIDPSGLEQYGLVAEEVAEVYPDLVVYDEKGQPQTVRYHFVNAMLLNEVQKQVRQINAQAKQIETLTARLAQLEGAVNAQGHTPAVEASYRTGPGL